MVLNNIAHAMPSWSSSFLPTSATVRVKRPGLPTYQLLCLLASKD